MTILECYYTKIRTLNIRLHQWAHKKIVLYVDLSLTPTFVLNGLFLCSLLSSLGAFSLIWRNFCSAMTALDLKSFLRFWLLSDRDKATHKYRKRNRVRAQERGVEGLDWGGGRHRTDFDTFLAIGSDTLSLSAAFFLPPNPSSSSLSLLFVVSRAILSKQEQPHLWSKRSGFD